MATLMDDTKTKALTVRDALEILPALEKLDGCKFGNPGLTHIRIAKNILALRALRQDIEDAHKKLVLEISPLGMINEATPEKVRYVTEWDKVMRSPMDSDLLQLRFEDLNVEENNINPTTLATLGPILIGLPELV